ncbi:hypothetical protein [Blastopirellula marina]|uniref:Uncharacterized protein n=1 Tax=Blastopirellula marina TaxID=124 RepID=A0A2S8GCP8_9BACT|nr:hypothetical protein [Blastopirellula marina]PQO42236.1 hypothetical protein C5Y93_28225 [Blastopirellula marina]
MRLLAVCALSFAVCVVSVGSVVAASPRVLVEVAYVVRTQEKPGEKTFEEEIAAAIENSEFATAGLNPLLDEWLDGQDRSKFEIDCLRIKGPVGETLEIQTQRSIGADPRGEVANEGMTGFPAKLKMDVGMFVEVTAKESEEEEGNFDLAFRFQKRTPEEMLSVTGPKGRSVLGFRTFMVDTSVTIDPKVPSVLGGLTSEKREKDQTQIREAVLIFRVMQL